MSTTTNATAKTNSSGTTARPTPWGKPKGRNAGRWPQNSPPRHRPTQEVEAVEALAARLKEAAREAPQPEPSPALREASRSDS